MSKKNFKYRNRKMNNDKFKNHETPAEESAEALHDDLKNETPEDVAIEDVDATEMNDSDDPNEQIQGLEQQILDLNQALEKEKKEYLFLMAEFDNFRKRTLKEKSEIIKNAGEQAFKGLLPIIDDFERGIKASSETDNAESVKEGMELIYNKLVKYLEQNGVKPMDTEAGSDFDTASHEAISVVPVPDESAKGKIIDTVQKGYTINDKVLRHAKVVVGQ